MSASPLVSVVVPAYNAASYLMETLQGISSQTLQDFELLVIDDGSTDGTPELLERYRVNEPRLKIIRQPNLGPAAARNNGWRAARGRYIAWNDADDISLPLRLEEQVEYMESHPQVGVCGTWVEVLGRPGENFWSFPLSDADIRSQMIFVSPFASSSTLVRSSLYKEEGLAYNEDFRQAEDYELWSRAMDHCQMANLPVALLRYRLHSTSLSRSQKDIMLECARRVRQAQILRMDLQPSLEELDLHDRLSSHGFYLYESLLPPAGRWLIKLLAANRRAHLFPDRSFKLAVGKRWLDACRGSYGRQAILHAVFWRLPLASLSLDWYFTRVIFSKEGKVA